jgi:transposase-like protein
VPIGVLLDDEMSIVWLQDHFHPQGLKCPHCHAGLEHAREFRRTKTSGLVVYRCRFCHGVYNLYSGTVFEGRHLRPSQVVLLMRGVCKGEPTSALARELRVCRQTAVGLRRTLQVNLVTLHLCST